MSPERPSTCGRRGRGSLNPVRAQLGSTPWCTTERQGGVDDDAPAGVPATTTAISETAQRRVGTPPIPRVASGGSRSDELVGALHPFEHGVDAGQLEDALDRRGARYADQARAGVVGPAC